MRLPAFRDASSLERFRTRRIAIDRIDAVLPQRAHGVHVQLDHRRCDAVVAEQPHHGPAGWAKSNDDGAVARIGRALRRGTLRGRRGSMMPDSAAPTAAAARAIQRSMGRIVRYASGFSTIDAIDVATSALVAAVVRMPSSRPIVARMNENSPICASAIANGQRRSERIPHRPDQQECDERLADEHDRQRTDAPDRETRSARRDPAACRRRRRTARRRHLAWAGPLMPRAGCSRSARPPCRRETRRAPSRR